MKNAEEIKNVVYLESFNFALFIKEVNKGEKDSLEFRRRFFKEKKSDNIIISVKKVQLRKQGKQKNNFRKNNFQNS